ncbi:MAG: APC family permease [Bacteroidetes bacterium]|nr:APC family permease [Bacteroidota bacterium]
MSANKKLSLFDISLIVVSLVIGMGIFRVPASVAATSGTATIFFGVWITGGLIALCGALTYAEIGKRLPAMGGYYKVFAECYHPAIGFSVNTIILISNAASLAIVTLIGADYVSDLLYGKPSGTFFNTGVAIAAVGTFYLVNLSGLRTSSRTQNLLTIAKLTMVVVLIASALKGVMVEPHGYNTGDPSYTLNDKSPWLLFLISLIPVSFAFGGYQQTINFGAEAQKPSGIPRGILIGIGIVTLLYLSINLAYTKVIGYEPMKNATAIGALLCEAWFGKAGAKVFDGLMFLSVMAYVNVILLSNPRVMLAMSQDKVFPKLFGYRNEKTGAISNSLTIFALTTILISFFGKGIDPILNFSMFLDSIGMATSAAGIFILRKRQHASASSSNTQEYSALTPYVAGFFIVAYIAIATGVFLKDPTAAWTGTILFFVFLIIYRLFYHNRK